MPLGGHSERGAGGNESRSRLPADLVWDEYKYRHDLCWRLVFQITAGVVAISVVPYLEKDIANELGRWILVLPSIGVALAFFGWLRLRKEQAILDEVRKRHRELHPTLYGVEAESDGRSFKLHTDLYLLTLVIVGLLNVGVIVRVWLPSVT
jgi:hypothetical protein